MMIMAEMYGMMLRANMVMRLNAPPANVSNMSRMPPDCWLKMSCRFVPGIRPGKNTANYLDYILTRLTVVGSLYLACISIMPEILISQYSVPFYLGGTSLLIVVTVTMDTVAQVQSHLLAHQYEGLIKKSKIRGRRG